MDGRTFRPKGFELKLCLLVFTKNFKIVSVYLNHGYGVNSVSDTLTKRINAYTIDGDLFIALINAEEQYSIWPAKKEIPAGWKVVGPSGSKQEISTYIDKNWTDMRPASLRRAMDNPPKP